LDDAAIRARREVERWFVSRGVPQLIQGYGDEQRLDARATPLIAGWIALGTVLWWANRDGASPARNAITIALSLVFMASVYVVVSRLRGRRLLERPRTWDLADIATFGVLPGIPAAVVHGPAAGAFAVGNALLGIGAIYLVIVFGIPEIAMWAVHRVGSQLEQIVRLIARTLPLLLILVVFLLFSAEIWEAAHALDGREILIVLALLTLIAVLLILTTFQSEIQRIEARSDWSVFAAEARSTPAEALFQRLPREAPEPPPPFRGRERANLTLLVVVSQLVQSIFVGLVVAGFLVIFGLIAIPAVVQESWIGDSVRVLGRFEFLGEPRTASGELVAVASLLGAITGLYFTGLALTDAAYRSEYFAHVVAEVEQIASVRAVYLAAPSGDQASP
jgi:sterol desaturase/sphingolipid hydroxylase (fatty acid hydroxylase superfamily)